MSYTFTKSVCERYDLRFDHEWAIFTIDENGGLFNCHSSYGNYSYSWPRHGRKSFKYFLVEIARSPDYLLRKVSDETYFNFEQSAKQWKQEIVVMRKDDECSKEDAREAWDFINDLDDSMSRDYAMNEVFDSSAINKIWSEPWDVLDFIKEYPRDARVFVDKIMPMFAEILKEEIGQQTLGSAV